MKDRYASLKEGLVGCWIPSVSGSGFLLPDVSGYGNHGTLINMASNDWVSSQYGRALDFDGTNDYVGLGNILGFEYNQAFSVSTWFNCRQTKFHQLISKQDPSTALGYELGTSFSFPGRLVFELSHSISPSYRALIRTSSDVIINNRWQHIYAKSTGNGLVSGLSIYLDGVELQVDVLADTLGNRSIVNAIPLNIAARNNGADALVDGQLDDIRIYNRVLSESEIRLLAQEPGIGFKRFCKVFDFGRQPAYDPPPATDYRTIRIKQTDHASLREGLVGAWCPSIAGSGFTLPDLSGYGNHGTLTNMAADDWVSSPSGRCLDIDATNDLINCGSNTSAMLNGKSAMSCACWFTKLGSGGGGFGRIFEFGNSSRTFLYDGTVLNLLGTGGGVNVQLSTAISNGLRFYAFVVVLGVSVNIYVDGENVPLSLVTLGGGTFIFSTNNLILCNREDAQRAMGGLLHEIRLYDRALSASEIRILAQRPGIGLTTQRRTAYYAPPSFNAGRLRRQQLIGSGVY